MPDNTRHRTLIADMQHHLVYLYLVCSHNSHCDKTGPTLRSHVLHRLILYGTLKIVYSETTEPRVYIWHVASSSRLTKFVENYYPVAENEAASGINVLYIVYIIEYSIYREHIKTHSCHILKGWIFDMWYSTKFVQIMALWSEWHRPGGHRVYEAVIVF